MNTPWRTRDAAWFGTKFLGSVMVCLLLWSYVLPYYVWLVGEVSGILLKYLGGVRVDAVEIESRGVLHTSMTLTYAVRARRWSLEIGLLANTVPPYFALVIATAGLAWSRRVRLAATGLAVLAFTHVLFVFLFYTMKNHLEAAEPFLHAVGTFLLTMPLFLWIVLVYWQQVFVPARQSTSETGS